MATIRAYLSDNNTITTRINATDEEAVNYYLGRLIDGKKCVAVEVLKATTNAGSVWIKYSIA